MAKPIPENPLIDVHYKFPPEIVKMVNENSGGKYKNTKFVIECIKEHVKRKEQLAQTINPKK